MIPRKNHILIVEDNLVVQHVLQATLEYGEYTHETAGTAKQSLEMFQNSAFDIILLDLCLPDVHGTELITLFRAQSSLPILVVSGLTGEQDRIQALDLGADDFIQKPFLPGELLARIRAALRRHQTAHQMIRIGDATFDPKQPFIRTKTTTTGLTKAEHTLLTALARQPSSAISCKELAEAVWGSYDESKERNLRVLISHLRKKIEPHPKYPAYIISHHGVGYRLNT